MGDDAELYMEMQEPGFWDWVENCEEEQRIKKRNNDWYELKQLRDTNKISADEFKKRKAIIFAYENEIKAEEKAYFKSIKELAKKSSDNQSELRSCIKCGCYYCVSIYTVYEIKNYTDDGTAICPYCGQKTVISSRSGGDDEQLLEDMHSLFYPDIDEENFD